MKNKPEKMRMLKTAAPLLENVYSVQTPLSCGIENK